MEYKQPGTLKLFNLETTWSKLKATFWNRLLYISLPLAQQKNYLPIGCRRDSHIHTLTLEANVSIDQSKPREQKGTEAMQRQRRKPKKQEKFKRKKERLEVRQKHYNNVNKDRGKVNT